MYIFYLALYVEYCIRKEPTLSNHISINPIACTDAHFLITIQDNFRIDVIKSRLDCEIERATK